MAGNALKWLEMAGNAGYNDYDNDNDDDDDEE